jgi:CheY-like chemotaxis protein/HPt (histidine-containing phosphotransfer) domain-containing protein
MAEEIRDRTISKDVLIIDDQRITLKFAEDFFKRLKFKVRCALNGYEGLKLVFNSLPDLILLDLMMPHLDGFKTLQLLKLNSATKDIPVIVMTAYTDRINVLSAVKMGASAILTKPLTEEILLEKLRDIFGDKFIQSIIPRDPKEKENPFGVNEEEYSSRVRELVEEFVEYYAEQIKELESGVRKKDVDKIRKITHNILGTSGSFGYDEAATLAAELNEMVHSTSINWDEAERLLLRLKNGIRK